MPINQDLVVEDGNILDPHTGLYLPAHVARGNEIGTREIPAMLKGLLEQKGYFDQSLYKGFYQNGFALHRDENTLVVHFPSKGTNPSELLLSSLASGEVENVGVSPVPYPQLPGLLRRQQIQAQSLTLDITGRISPVKKAVSAIARFNDSPMGVTQAVSEMVYNLRVFCKGSPIATIPIVYDMTVWGENGMTAVPILAEGATESDAKQFYLQVDWGGKVKTPIPYIADPMRFRPSGLPTWPYWFLAEDNGVAKWVLLHQSHVIPIVPGNSLRYSSLIGTSSVWICLGFLAENFLIIEERVERKISAATNGLLGISGVSQTGDQIAKQIELQTEIRKTEGKYFASDYTILASNSNKIVFTFLPLRQHDGVPPKERREYEEDTLALAFNEPLTAVVSRGGIGFSTNAPENAAQTSDTGIAAILEVLEVALGTMFPRVSVTISRQNDPSQRLNVSTFKEFASAIKDVNAAVEGDPVLSREEIRTLIDRDLFPLPDIENDTVSSDATADESDKIKEVGDGSDSDEETTEGDNGTEMEATIREVESYILNARYELEAITPVGADSPIPEAEPDPEAVTTDGWNEDMPELDGMLDADPSDDEEFPARSTENNLAESWLWLIQILTYHNVRSGRTIDEASAIEVRDELAIVREIWAIDLAGPLAVGDATLQAWVADMRDVTQRSYVHQFMLGRGGSNMMTDEGYEWLLENINIAYTEIDYLAERMAMGAYSEAQIASYSQTLVGSAVQGYEAGRAAAWGIPSLPDYPGSFRLDCRGRCRCHWRHKRIFDDPRFVRIESYWELDPRAQHCTSCRENNAMYYPFTTEVP